MKTLPDGVVDELAGCLRDQICQQLDLTPAGCPDRACVMAGNPQSITIEDCCAEGGQLSVAVSRLYPAVQFPIPAVGTERCDAPYTVIEFFVTVSRCHPTGERQPPDCDALVRAFEVQSTDLLAMQRGVQCCLDQEQYKKTRWMTGDHTTVGPEGNCVWSVLPVAVGVVNCEMECPT